MSSSKNNDLTGQRFGRLVAGERLEQRSEKGYSWRCVCDCGRQVDFSYNELVHLGVRSCLCAKNGKRKQSLQTADNPPGIPLRKEDSAPAERI